MIRHDPSGDEYMALGIDCNWMVAGLHHQRLERDGRDETAEEGNDVHLNCWVTKEKTRI